MAAMLVRSLKMYRRRFEECVSDAALLSLFGAVEKSDLEFLHLSNITALARARPIFESIPKMTKLRGLYVEFYRDAFDDRPLFRETTEKLIDAAKKNGSLTKVTTHVVFPTGLTKTGKDPELLPHAKLGHGCLGRQPCHDSRRSVADCVL